ncbi:hypothetical protein CVT26_014940 [Gymnopilus dilepis]|uniref:Uncharacterized protein n=1 Tax=Gymnopilus dilepis TaxID=231916 RepID=A0A409XWX1_9AGAR|nr:hypothetical protein CVT26_014940 [Gymnopilus dilepis]
MASSNPTASSSSSSYASTSTTSTSASSSNPTFNPNAKSKSKSSDASQYQSQSHSISPPPGPHPTVKVRRVPWATHALRQLKLVLPGALITYYLGTFHDFWSILQGTSGGALARCVGSMFYAVISRINFSFVRCDRFSGWAASGLALLTIGLFLYMLFLPWITGEEPNYQAWRESGLLSSIIPLLTGSIVIGWLLAVSTLGQWSPIGYVKGTIGVSAFYALTFGLLGLIPVPRITSRSKAH